MVVENLDLGGKHTMQYTDDDVSYNLYTCNLHNLINHCHSNKFNLKNKINKIIKIILSLY